MTIGEKTIANLADHVRLVAKIERLENSTSCRPNPQKITALTSQDDYYLVQAQIEQAHHNHYNPTSPQEQSIAYIKDGAGLSFEERALDLMQHLNSRDHGVDRLCKNDPRIRTSLRSHYRNTRNPVLQKMIASRVDKAMTVPDRMVQKL